MSDADVYLEDDPLWFKDAVVYEVHLKGFYDSNGDGIGDFRGLISKLDYLTELGVTAIWILPFYPSPQRDDGYDIADYFGVHPQYGNLNHFKEFLEEAHKREIRVITELVLNHTSDQHPWFQSSRRSKPGTALRDLYVWSESAEKYKEARIIFKDFESSNWAWDPVAQAYYWHRFYSHQPDLNYDSLEVRRRIFEVVDFWLKLGVDGLRLDAVPYLFEREGTNCENLPETHAFLKELRAHIDQNFKNRMLLAEANQWPTDAATYFGSGDECHMAFHFPLMPRLFMSIELEDRFPIIDIYDNTPPIPDNCQWALFLRNHDELTLEMVTDEERDYMYRAFAKDKHARINLGIRRRLAPLMANDRRKIELINVLLFTLPGTPVLYYGDEIGMGDDYYLGDRNGVRTPMQWSADPNAGFSKASPKRLYLPVITDPEYHYEAVNVENQSKSPSSLLWWFRKIISVRKYFKAFGRGEIEFQFPENNRIIAYFRKYMGEVLLVVANLSQRPQVAELDLSAYEGYVPVEVIGGTTFPKISKLSYMLTFGPYRYYIFSLVKPSETQPHQIVTKPEMLLRGDAGDLFKGKHLEKMEREILPIFMKGKAWLAGRDREIDQVKIRDLLPIDVPGARVSKIALIDVYFQEGLPEAYLLPIAFASGQPSKEINELNPGAIMAKVNIGREDGIIYDGAHNASFRKALLNLITKRMTIVGDKGELRGLPRERIRLLLPDLDGLDSKLYNADQSNTSIIFSDKAVLKIYRKAEEGINPELEINEFLAKASFPHIPPLLGEVKYFERGTEPITVGILQGYVENKGDAWTAFLGEVDGFFGRVLSMKGDLPAVPPQMKFLLDPADEMPEEVVRVVGERIASMTILLGKRTGELHRAMLSAQGNPDFEPEPFGYLYQFALSQSMISYAKRVLQSAARAKEVGEGIRESLSRVLSNQELVYEKFRTLRAIKIEAVKTRIHGDYHLGQLLWTGSDFIIIDFEGEPERALSDRRIKRSPLRDVAGMIRSFHYLAQTGLMRQYVTGSDDKRVLERWSDSLYKYCSNLFIRAYLETVRDTKIAPQNWETFKALVTAYVLEKAIYELNFELKNRPNWAAIPLRGIIDMLGI